MGVVWPFCYFFPQMGVCMLKLHLTDGRARCRFSVVEMKLGKVWAGGGAASRNTDLFLSVHLGGRGVDAYVCLSRAGRHLWGYKVALPRT